LVCPRDKGKIELHSPEYDLDEIKTGLLKCTVCGQSYPVVNFIARFAENEIGSEALGGLQHRKDPRKIKEFLRGFYSSNPHYHQLIDKTEKSGYTYDHILLGLIERLKKNRENIQLLDIASGTGHYLERAFELGVSAYGIDLSSHACEMTREKNPNLSICQADAETLPFKGNEFDIILCLQLLEHTPFPETVVGEITRILKPGGYLFLSAPNRLGSKAHTRLFRIVKGFFSKEIKNLKTLPNDILERWKHASSTSEVADLDACNKTNIFQAMRLLKKNGLTVEYFDTLRHPQKYKPWKYSLATLAQRIPLLKYNGISFKIIARKP
jgi:ubiquinone/menaquinone biosynthesis C-methylase UbiE/uncharacterized protein YbaR (Trm112 family)